MIVSVSPPDFAAYTRLECNVLGCTPYWQRGRAQLSRDVSRLHPCRTWGSFDHAHVLSHMSEMGGAGISALKLLYYYYTMGSEAERSCTFYGLLH
jgi:hypothetical protein